MSRECDCRRVKRAMAAIERNRIGDLVRQWTFETYEAREDWQKNVKARAEQFAADCKGKWFFIGGQDGSGKTRICTAIVGRLMEHGIPVRYMKWVGESEQLKAAVNDFESYNDLMWPLKNADVLYIDDLFKTGDRIDEHGRRETYPTPADIRLAFEIINFRYLAFAPTIISCQRGIKKLIEIDSATGGRIYERSGEYCIDVGNSGEKNMRLKV